MGRTLLPESAYEHGPYAAAAFVRRREVLRETLAALAGTVAQEENMFRRTDCHFAVDASQLDPQTERYRPEHTALLNGEGGRVLLDASRPRVCLRGPEDRDDPRVRARQLHAV